jgi:hypothetical protein
MIQTVRRLAAAASKLAEEKVPHFTHLTASHVKCLRCGVVICTCCFSVLLRGNWRNVQVYLSVDRVVVSGTKVLRGVFRSEREEVTDRRMEETAMRYFMVLKGEVVPGGPE